MWSDRRRQILRSRQESFDFFPGGRTARRRMAIAAAGAVITTISFVAAAAPPAESAPATTPTKHEVIVEPIFDSGVKGRWQDWGWSPRDTDAGNAARINFANMGGWVLARRGLTGTFSSLVFYMAAPGAYGDFLEVYLGADDAVPFEHVPVDAQVRTSSASGWSQVRIPMQTLNPNNAPFDRVILHAHRAVGDAWVNIDKMALLGGADDAGAVGAARAGALHHSSGQIDCSRGSRPISSLIYGIAHNPRRADSYQWKMGASGRRFGGSPASRYNWRLGNAWNAGDDWFFANVDYSHRSDYSWRVFFDENGAHNAQAALTVPLIGWVARDTQAYGFPVRALGPQQQTSPQNPDMGNGLRPDGSRLPIDPQRTSIGAPPAYVGDWVRSIRRYDEDRRVHSVAMYILDNEPFLWNVAHRDVHPDAVGYDELLQRTVAYAHEVRQADPSARIAGPAEYGWPALFYSAKDAAGTFARREDRRAHGDQPLLAWYLAQLHAHEERTGERLINIVDVHFYPQGDGIYGSRERNDAGTAQRRIRATRSLWDNTYVDESWINDRIRLLPRLRALIADNYPGLDISIGEYNFGGERTMSGGLALAEALGRFGQEGLYAAYYWTYPPDNSPAYQAFAAYRNYDGQGGHFMDRSLPTLGDRSTSLFASIDEAKGKIVAVALNLDSREASDAAIDLLGCGNVTTSRTFQYTGAPEGLTPLEDKAVQPGHSTLHQRLPPYSITVFEVGVRPAR